MRNFLRLSRAVIGTLCVLSVLGVPCLAQTQHYNFTYPNRASFVADGWDFLAVTAAGATRNTEQTTGEVVSYDVAPGVLQIPVDTGDLWGTQNNSRNTLFHTVPTNWTSMRLFLSFAPTQSYQQVGLVAYQDDDNYVNITRIFNGTNLISFAVEQSANPTVVNSVSITATSFYLRLDRNITTNTITGSYSLDGVTWVQVGSTVMSLNNPQLAVFPGGSPSGFPPTNLTWAEYDAGTVPLAVSSVSMAPASVTGGSTSQGTVTLNQAAPTGGTVVTLSSSNTAAATVPASVTVTAGQTTATFTASTTTVTASTSATITASYSGTSAAATLTVAPASSAFTEYDFTYANRTAFLAAGWDFLAVTATGASRNTEQTTGQVVSYNVAPGVLQIPVDSGDLWGTQNDSRNTLFHTVPSTWTSMRLFLSFAPTQSYQQVGLVAYQDDDNYVNLTRIFNGANQISFAVETKANPTVTNSVTVTATSFYLRLDRDPTTNTITGYYSLDNNTWTQVGSTVLALNNPQLAVFPGGSPSGFPLAKLTWAQVMTGGASGSGVTLGVNPTSVIGGTSSTGTVTLSAAAPAGGTVVTLGSSNSAVAAVPASVTVTSGQTTATFTATTTAVTTATPVTITASYSSGSTTATLTVNPAGVSSLTLNPTGVTGGISSTGTVTLSAAAPTGGTTVTLSSSNTSVATVPASVTVSGGQTTATFTVTTSSVTGTAQPTITATSGSSSANATLTVNPGSVDPTLSYRRAITISNTGSALNNYQVKISLTSSNMTFSHAKSDGSDVRVRASDGITDLAYWIESWNSSSQTATLWVNASSLPAGTSTLYLVYGNSSATSTASGTNTFMFFDDFSSADSTTQLGYMQESAVGTVNMGAAQAWEGGDVPHFFSVVTRNAAINGTTYKYWAYYGTHNVPGVGIGLAGSNDMVNWTKYSGNPVVSGVGRAPSVIQTGSTFAMAYETEWQIGYQTSPDGINWTEQSNFVSSANNESTPHLWQNPNDSKYYLYWSDNPSSPSNTSQPSKILARSATTVAGLLTASTTTVWSQWVGNTPNNGTIWPFYAPHMYYDTVSSQYLLMFESQPPDSSGDDTTWDNIVLQSSSPTSGFSLAAGNSYHPGGYACPENYVAGTTLYTYYCYNNGSTWVIRYTTASITAGRQVFGRPKTALWTKVEPSGNTQAPNWYLVPCTDWKGASGQCLKGFGRFGQDYTGQDAPSYLASSFSGTNYIMESRVYPIDSNDALVAARIAGTSSPGQAFNVMLNDPSNTLTQVATPGSNQISSVGVGSIASNTWYHIVTTVQGTTMTTSFNDGASTTTGTSSADSSGSVGPGLDMQSTSMFDNIFVHQYAAVVPTNSVGSEQSGSF